LNFLLDENVPFSLKRTIKELGFNVLTLKELKKQGIVNGEVAKLAIKKESIIITFDSDFLTLKKELQNISKIIYIKLHPRDPKVANQLINENLKRCINLLQNAGKVILSKTSCEFKKPSQV